MEEMEIIRRWNVPGIRMFLNTVEYRTAHFHADWELLWILENPMQIITLQHSFRAEPGQLILLTPNMPHEFRKIEGGCTFLCVQVSRDFSPGIENLVMEGHVVDEFLDTGLLRRELARCAAMYFRRERFYEMEVTGSLNSVLYRIFTAMPSHNVSVDEARNMDKRNARLLRLQKFVDENYMHKIRLQDFAREEGCTVSFLSHFVRDCLNQTFQEYVTSVRFNSACQQIAAGNTKMLDVCMESGFSDYRYFTRAFRQYSGMTPDEFCRSETSHLWEDNLTRRSIHSLEHFYTTDQSLQYLKDLGYLEQLEPCETDDSSKNAADSKIV